MEATPWAQLTRDGAPLAELKRRASPLLRQLPQAVAVLTEEEEGHNGDGGGGGAGAALTLGSVRDEQLAAAALVSLCRHLPLSDLAGLCKRLPQPAGGGGADGLAVQMAAAAAADGGVLLPPASVQSARPFVDFTHSEPRARAVLLATAFQVLTPPFRPT